MVFIHTATYGRDYDIIGLPRVLSFVSGQSLHSLSCTNVSIIDDVILEEVENFTVVLSTGFPGVIISERQSIVQIIDNDNSKWRHL